MLTDDEKRLTVRDRVRESNTELNKTASASGAKNFAFFHDAGYRGMYAMSARQSERKASEPREDFRTPLGRLESAAMNSELP